MDYKWKNNALTLQLDHGALLTATISNGRLPLYFDDTLRKVPQRFHKQLMNKHLFRCSLYQHDKLAHFIAELRGEESPHSAAGESLTPDERVNRTYYLYDEEETRVREFFVNLTASDESCSLNVYGTNDLHGVVSRTLSDLRGEAYTGRVRVACADKYQIQYSLRNEHELKALKKVVSDYRSANSNSYARYSPSLDSMTHEILHAHLSKLRGEHVPYTGTADSSRYQHHYRLRNELEVLELKRLVAEYTAYSIHVTTAEYPQMQAFLRKLRNS